MSGDYKWGKSGGPQNYSKAEVAVHNKPNDCWIIIDKKVYDLSHFIEEHPGGTAVIENLAGKDATEQFGLVHERSVIQKYASHTYIGDLLEVEEEPSLVAEQKKHCPFMSGPSEGQLLYFSNKESEWSGGTADLLPNERKKASFDVKKMH